MGDTITKVFNIRSTIDLQHWINDYEVSYQCELISTFNLKSTNGLEICCIFRKIKGKGLIDDCKN